MTSPEPMGWFGGPRERRARAWLVALCLLGLVALGLACGGCPAESSRPSVGEECRAWCERDCVPFGVAQFGWVGGNHLCVCVGAQPDGGAGGAR